jgi:hypothetical protein
MNREEKTVFWNKWRVFYPLLADLFRSYSGGRSSHRGHGCKLSFTMRRHRILRCT